MSHLKSVHLKYVHLKNVLSKIRPSKKRRGPACTAGLAGLTGLNGKQSTTLPTVKQPRGQPSFLIYNIHIRLIWNLVYNTSKAFHRIFRRYCTPIILNIKKQKTIKKTRHLISNQQIIRFRCKCVICLHVYTYIDIEFDQTSFDEDYFRRFVRPPDKTSNWIWRNVFSVIDVFYATNH